MVIEQYNPTGSSTQDGEWLARIAAWLLEEDATQSYAIISIVICTMLSLNTTIGHISRA